MDTNGTRAEKRCGMYNFDIEFSAMDGEKTTSLDYTSFSTVDLDTPLLETAGLSLKFENTLKQLDVKPMEGKFVGTLVLDPGMTRWLFVDNLTNMISGSSALEKTSIYLDKVNQKIADERLSIVYDEEDERVLGTSILTGDGFKTEKFTLLDKGVLKSFVGDLMVENKTGFKHALNNLEGLKVLPGEKSIRDIIKGIDKGLYCGGFSGGQPGINGEFSGVAKNSFLIENGEITTAVTETMISGNINDMLNALVDISAETVCDGNAIVPYTAFEGITVSGK